MTWNLFLLQAESAPLQLMCGSQVAAQGISAAAGQAVTSAIPKSFGPDPCKIFKGDKLLLHVI